MEQLSEIRFNWRTGKYFDTAPYFVKNPINKWFNLKNIKNKVICLSERINILIFNIADHVSKVHMPLEKTNNILSNNYNVALRLNKAGEFMGMSGTQNRSCLLLPHWLI